MVVRRTSYPQVEPRARDLATRAVAVVVRRRPLDAAAQVARWRRSRLVLARRSATSWDAVTAGVLERAVGLGLGAAPLPAVLWEAPAVAAATPEMVVRQRLGPGRPFAVVLEGGRPIGAVVREDTAVGQLPRSVAGELARVDAGTLDVLRAAGRLGAESGEVVAAVGGFVRDLVRGPLAQPPRDLDVVVAGNGQRLARRLAVALGGSAREHPAFLTATIALPDGRSVDVATARRERYRAPGALPAVEPARLAEDLWRRDFSVNALAVRLDDAGWGEVEDPTGGLTDLARGWIRVLHPLSLVEDPTRVFRAVRFAERLGFRLEPTTRRLLDAAVGLPVYDALSGDRLRAELARVLEEPDPARVLAALGRLGAYRLGRPAYRFTAAAAARLAAVGRCLGALPLAAPTRLALVLLALTASLRPDAAAGWLERYGATPPERDALDRARREAPGLAERLAGAAGSGEAYAALRQAPELSIAWTWVLAGRPGPRRLVAAHLGRWRDLPPLLDGDDLRALGLSPGPRFGRLLAALRVAQVAGRVRTRAEAEAWVRRGGEGRNGSGGGKIRAAMGPSGRDHKGG
jgi:tRNA nucleotidyltransferase (CCA-adding enzyme)